MNKSRVLRIRRQLLGLCAVLALAAKFWCPTALASTEAQPLHTSGDKQLWHRKNENRVELFGHASVSQPGETLTADYISMDLNNRVLDAKGNCVYFAGSSVIYGEEMHFNLDTRTGSVVSGRVTNEKFSLSGERINKIGEGRFQTHWGEYSTCHDCPGTWSLLAEDVDMQVEGYAYMSNVTAKVSDAPTFWLPYLVVPMKTRRQTGLLFPSFSFGASNGTTFVLPFFWAINRSSDMTIGLGYFTARGSRLEWEGRYALSPRSGGKANFYYLQDKQFIDDQLRPLGTDRFALDVAQTQELPLGIEEKLRITEVSDNSYPREIGDVPGVGELTMPSSLSFSYASSDLSAFVVGRRYRNLVNTDPDPVKRILQFDPRTVQELPSLTIATNDRLILGTPVAFSLTAGLTNFVRSGDAFDYDFTQVPFGATAPPSSAFSYAPGVSPIRKATRFTLTPSIYTALRPFDVFTLVPSVKYFTYLYTFPESENFRVPSLLRNYLLLQADLSTQFEKVYEYPEDKASPRVKHLIRPMLTYSYIPPSLVREDQNHPFLSQIKHATDNNLSGYYFDDYDIVPIDSSPTSAAYFTPLGNSIQFGVKNQWIRRDGAIDSPAPSYVKYIEATAGEAVNFREFQRCDQADADGNCIAPHAAQPFSRFYQTLELNLGRFGYSHQYYWYPYIPGFKSTLSASMGYSVANSGLHQGIYSFDRSFVLNFGWDQHGVSDPGAGTRNLTGTFNYSLSDYILPSLSASYDSVHHTFLGANLNLQFQSPSRCWKFTVNVPYVVGTGVRFNFDLALNLTGSGFGGVGEVANTVVSK